MKPVLAVAEMRRVDEQASESVDVLMERAGLAVALAAVRMGIGYGSVVDVLCGAGNNGGDGYVASAFLADRGAAVRIHALEEPERDTPPGRAAHRAAAAGARIDRLGGEIRPGALVVDALFGTGFRGQLPEQVLPWTRPGVPVLAVDIPSGVAGDTGDVQGEAFTADHTVTFHALKLGHILGEGPDRCGVLEVADIGLSGGEPVMSVVEERDVRIPVRPRTSHKWSSGAVATIGGMPGLTGAAAFTARAALRSGAGVSSILTTAATAGVYEALVPDITTMQASESDSWRDHASEVLALLGRYDVLVVGPGLEPAPTQFVERLLVGFDGPMVVDAGAIAAIQRLDTLLERTPPTVLTPHAGEFRRFSGMDADPFEAHRLAEATQSIILLKGNPTFVAGSELVVVDRGGPELATIGSGDVLAGTIAAFLATGMDAETAARSGAFINAVAGSRLAESDVVTAPGLVEEVGRTVVQIGDG